MPNAPVPAAAPGLPDATLLRSYETWLAQELRTLVHEIRPSGDGQVCVDLTIPAWDWHADRMGLLLPSTRAALVLSAVGCPWREGL